MYEDFVKTKILKQRSGNWPRLKDRLVQSVTTINLLSRKMATEFSFASKVLKNILKKRNGHSNLTPETGGFSQRGTTSLLLLKRRHNTLYCTPSNNQSIQFSEDLLSVL